MSREEISKLSPDEQHELIKKSKQLKTKPELGGEAVASGCVLLVIFGIGIFWNKLFLKDGTGTIGWIIYGVGGLCLLSWFLSTLSKLINRVTRILGSYSKQTKQNP